MPVIYSDALKRSRMAAVGTALGTASQTTPNHIVLLDAENVVLANVPFATTMSVTHSGAGIMTFNGGPWTCQFAFGTGTASQARVRSGFNGEVVLGLSVGLSGAECNLSSLDIVEGQEVIINSLVLTHG